MASESYRLAIARSICCGLPLLVAAFACTASRGDSAPSTPAGLTTPTVDAKQALANFSIRSVQSFAEAEAVTGFHIVRPGSDFPMRYGETAIRQLKGGLPASETLYRYPAAPDAGLMVTVASVSTWPQGALARGTKTDIGPRTGWLIQDGRGDDPEYEFAFSCGSVAVDEIWCLVSASNQLPREVFDRFVSQLD